MGIAFTGIERPEVEFCPRTKLKLRGSIFMPEKRFETKLVIGSEFKNKFKKWSEMGLLLYL